MLQATHQEQEHNQGSDDYEEMYSPTSPLDLLHINNESGSLPDNLIGNSPPDAQEQQIVLALPVITSMFMGKQRRDTPYSKSHSLNSYFRFGGDEFEARLKRQKRKNGRLGCKGGFSYSW